MSALQETESYLRPDADGEGMKGHQDCSDVRYKGSCRYAAPLPKHHRPRVLHQRESLYVLVDRLVRNWNAMTAGPPAYLRTLCPQMQQTIHIAETYLQRYPLHPMEPWVNLECALHPKACP